jgi:addiction module RelB/DinJ family antitoxin
MVFNMATKSANVTARVQPEVKQQAEAVLERIGLPVSVLIDTLYRQIIMTGGVPYSLSVPKLPTLDSMTAEQFDAMMEKGYREAQSGQGFEINEAFEKIREDI